MKNYFTPPPPSKCKPIVGFKTLLTAITMCCFTTFTNAQTTFTASTLRGDTVKSMVMMKATDISATGIVASDTIRAQAAVVAEQNLQVQGNLSLSGRFDLGNGLAMKSYPANTNHPAVFKFGSTSLILPGPGSNNPLDPEDVPSCSSPLFGSNPLFSFAGYLKSSSYISGSTGSAIFGHDGANAIIEVQGLSSSTIPGSLLINYNCHRNVAICTGASINPAENKVFIGDFINMRKHAEIGSATQVNDPANTSLDIFTNAGKGIKFTTYNNGLPLISVSNVNFTSSPFTVFGDGRTYIGVKKPIATGPHGNAMLAVDGKVLAREIYVNIHNSVWADYVFDKNYKLMPLNEVEAFVTKNKHLPNVPSAKDLTETDEYNLSLVDMQKIQMEKIEELYLHVINQQKQIEALQKKNVELEQKLKK